MAKPYTKSAYAEKLKDPRWQKLRLEVMQANDFCCEICGDAQSTLHVHHKAYIKGRDPWEYERKQLAVICENCHEMIHSSDDLLSYVCSFANLDGPGNRDEIAFIIASHLGLAKEKLFEISEYKDGPWVNAMYDVGSTIDSLESSFIEFYSSKYQRVEEL